MTQSNTTFFICLFILSLVVGGCFSFVAERYFVLGDFILSSMIFTLNILVWKKIIKMLIMANTKYSSVISLLFVGKIIILICSVWFMIGVFSIGSIMSAYVMVLSALLMSASLQTNKIGYSNG